MKNKPQKIGWFFFDPKYNTVLLHRRDHRANESKNMWDCFGGKIEAGETPREAFVRELYEELEISIKAKEAKRLLKDKLKVVYFIEFPDWKTRALRLGEGAGFAWFLIDDALELNKLTEEAKEILNEFKKKISKKKRLRKTN